MTEKKDVLGTVKKLCTRWFIDAFSGMALGLFCTLIAGTIISQIGTWCGDNAFGKVLVYIGSMAKMLMGAGIGVGIAYKLKCKPLVIFSAAVTGFVGAFAGNIVNYLCKTGEFLPIVFGAPGNPIGSYIVALFTIEIASLYAGKTKLDIVLVPLGMMILTLGGIFIAWPFIKFVDLIGIGIALAIHCRYFRCDRYGNTFNDADIKRGNMDSNRGGDPCRIRGSLIDCRRRCRCRLRGAYGRFCRNEFS